MSIFKGAGNGEQIHKKTDEYGNGNTGTGTAYGTQTGVDAQGGTLPLSSSGGEYGNKGHGGQGGGGILHRSNSSSSSSSEDDGQGGRRKKSIKEKIKEKLPGGNKPTAGQDTYAPGYGAATTKTTPGEGYGSHGTTATKHDARTEPEKKGVVEKIKEKLPGGNKPTTGQDAYAPGYGAATTKTTPGEGYGSHATTATKHDAYGTEPEKKGVAEKIKEKLPGGHQ